MRLLVNFLLFMASVLTAVSARADSIVVMGAGTEAAEKAFLKVAPCVFGAPRGTVASNQMDATDVVSAYQSLVRFQTLRSSWREHTSAQCDGGVRWFVVLDKGWIYKVNGTEWNKRTLTVQKPRAQFTQLTDEGTRAAWMSAMIGADDMDHEVAECEASGCADYHRAWIDLDDERRSVHANLMRIAMQATSTKGPIAINGANDATRMIVASYLRGGVDIDSPDRTCSSSWRLEYDPQRPAGARYQLGCGNVRATLSKIERIVYWPVPPPEKCQVVEYTMTSDGDTALTKDVLLLSSRSDLPRRKFNHWDCAQRDVNDVVVTDVFGPAELAAINGVVAVDEVEFNRSVSLIVQSIWDVTPNGLAELTAYLKAVRPSVQNTKFADLDLRVEYTGKRRPIIESSKATYTFTDKSKLPVAPTDWTMTRSLRSPVP